MIPYFCKQAISFADSLDYASLGGRNFIGNPKQPTISICNLIDGEYRITKFKNDDLITSQTFPDLRLTANQIFQAGGKTITPKMLYFPASDG